MESSFQELVVNGGAGEEGAWRPQSHCLCPLPLSSPSLGISAWDFNASAPSPQPVASLSAWSLLAIGRALKRDMKLQGQAGHLCWLLPCEAGAGSGRWLWWLAQPASLPRGLGLHHSSGKFVDWVVELSSFLSTLTCCFWSELHSHEVCLLATLWWCLVESLYCSH